MDSLDKTIAINTGDTHASASTAPAVSGYEVLEKLGEGGMSCVWKARHIELQQLVAIKVLAGAEMGANGVKRFMAEARNTASLKHPNIIQVHFTGKTIDEQPCLVMEFLQGKSLSEIIKTQGALKLPEFKEVFVPIASALTYAHSQGLIHRDLKPANIVIAESGLTRTAKLVDFGIAQFFEQADQSQKLTQTGAIIGSPAYMSPEQCSGAKLDARSDQYSIACVMYECLTGKPPFEGEGALDVMYKHLHINIAEDDPLETYAGKKIAAVLRKALAKEPQDRFASTSGFEEAIKQALEDVDEHHAAVVPGKMPPSRLVASLIALLAVSVLAAIPFAVKTVRQAKMPTTVEITHRTRLALDQADKAYQSGLKQQHTNQAEAASSFARAVKQYDLAVADTKANHQKQNFDAYFGRAKAYIAWASVADSSTAQNLRSSAEPDYRSALDIGHVLWPYHDMPQYQKLVSEFQSYLESQGRMVEAAKFMKAEAAVHDSYKRPTDVFFNKVKLMTGSSMVKEGNVESGTKMMEEATEAAADNPITLFWSLIHQVDAARAIKDTQREKELIARAAQIASLKKDEVITSNKVTIMCCASRFLAEAGEHKQAQKMMETAVAATEKALSGQGLLVKDRVKKQNLASCYFYLACAYNSDQKYEQTRQQMALFKSTLAGAAPSDPSISPATVAQLEKAGQK